MASLLSSPFFDVDLYNFIQTIQSLIKSGENESAEQLILEKKGIFPSGYLAALSYETYLTNKKSTRDYEYLRQLFTQIDWFPSKKEWLLDLFSLRTTISGVLDGVYALEDASRAMLKHSKKYPDDALALHEFGTFSYLIGASTTAIQCLSKSVQINPQRAEAKYDLGLALLAKGELKEGVRFYSYRWAINKSTFKTSIIPTNPKNRLRNKPVQGERVVIFSEQGIGDQIRVLPLVADFALKNSAEIYFLCDSRFAHHFRSNIPNLSIVSYERAHEFPHDKYIDGYGLLERYDSIADLSDLPSVDKILSIRYPVDVSTKSFIDGITLEGNDNYGFTWWSSAWEGLSRKAASISPSLDRICNLLGIDFEEAKFVSLQYSPESAKKQLYEHERKRVLCPPGSVDLRDDFSGVVEIARAMKYVFGPHSAQLLLAAISGTQVYSFIHQGDFLCLGDTDNDPLCPNLKFFRVKRNPQFPTFTTKICIDPY